MKIRIVVFALILICSFSAVWAQKVVISDNFSAEGVNELEVEGRFCNVRIQAHNAGKVDFRGEIKGKRLQYGYQIRHEQVGDKLKIWIVVDKNIRNNPTAQDEDDLPEWKTFNISAFSANFWLKIPKNVRVIVRNSSGRVFLDGLESNLLDIKTSSGSIHADNIVGNPIFKLSSGRLLVNNLKGNAIATTSSGSQLWERVQGNLNTTSSSGRNRFYNIKGDLSVNSSSGSVNLNDTEGKVSVSSTSGRIKGRHLLITNNSQFSASSGSIKVDFRNDLNDFKFDLKTGSGNVKVNGIGRVSIYKKEEGKIELVGVTSSGRQRYY